MIPRPSRALAIAAAAHLADWTTFAVAVALLGIGGEANPVARAAYASAGLAGPLALHAAAVAIVAAVVPHVHPRTRALALGILAAAGTFGAVTNTAAVLGALAP